MTPKELIEKFQCPGCAVGVDTTCGSFKLDNYAVRCKKHVLGTRVGSHGPIALGLPSGFNKPGRNCNGDYATQMMILLWPKGQTPKWDKFNIPVWAMVKDGFLFVRTFSPQINTTCVDIVEGGTLKMVPGAINMGES